MSASVLRRPGGSRSARARPLRGGPDPLRRFAPPPPKGRKGPSLTRPDAGAVIYHGFKGGGVPGGNWYRMGSGTKHAPLLDLERLPKVERETAEFIGHGLGNLGRYCDEVEAADLLLGMSEVRSEEMLKSPRVGQRTADFRNELSVLTRWMHIAARHGAFTIYNFGKEIAGIASNLKDCPVLQSVIDEKEWRTGGKLFARHFPNFEQVRNSAGHAGERNTPKAERTHRPKDAPYILNSLFGRSFTTSVEGRIVSYDLNPETVSLLVNIRDQYWGAFSAIDRLAQTEEE